MADVNSAKNTFMNGLAKVLPANQLGPAETVIDGLLDKYTIAVSTENSTAALQLSATQASLTAETEKVTELTAQVSSLTAELAAANQKLAAIATEAK